MSRPTEAQVITHGLLYGCDWHGRLPSLNCCECDMIDFYRENHEEATMRGVAPSALASQEARR